ncbi:MAG: hypothetical protein JW779_11935 [Candidatus Thorarchaeota archaeon]|nr:hypothetical protein [Candidatus Thorarchaeota archaeon]
MDEKKPSLKKEVDAWISKNSENLLFLECTIFWSKCIVHYPNIVSPEIIGDVVSNLSSRFQEKSITETMGGILHELRKIGIESPDRLLAEARKALNKYGLKRLMSNVRSNSSANSDYKRVLQLFAEFIDREDLWGTDLDVFSVTKLNSLLKVSNLFDCEELQKKGGIYRIHSSKEQKAVYIVPPHISLYLYEIFDIEEDIICPHCDKVFDTEEDLEAHVSTCPNLPTIVSPIPKCEKCGLEFKSETDLEIHLHQHHMEIDELPHPPFPKCSDIGCGASFLVRANFRRQDAHRYLKAILETAKEYVKIQDNYLLSDSFQYLQYIEPNVSIYLLTHFKKDKDLFRNMTKFSAIIEELDQLKKKGHSVKVAHMKSSAVHDRLIITENYLWGLSNSLHALGGSKISSVFYIPIDQKQYIERAFDNYFKNAKKLSLTDLEDLGNNLSVGWYRE